MVMVGRGKSDLLSYSKGFTQHMCERKTGAVFTNCQYLQTHPGLSLLNCRGTNALLVYRGGIVVNGEP